MSFGQKQIIKIRQNILYKTSINQNVLSSKLKNVWNNKLIK